MKLSNYQQTNKKVVSNYKKTKGAAKKEKFSEKKNIGKSGITFFGLLKSKRMVQVYGILFMAFAILLCLSLGYSFFHYSSIASFVESGTELKGFITGELGATLAYNFINYTFGFFSIGFALLFFIYGFKLTLERAILPTLLTTFTTLITMAWFSTVFGCFLAETKHNFICGPFGKMTSEYLIQHTQHWGTGLILFAALIIILVLFYNISPKRILETVGKIPSVLSDDKNTIRSHSQDKTSVLDETTRRLNNNDTQKLPGLYIEDMNKLRDEYDNKGITFIGEGMDVNNYKRNINEEEEEVELKILSAPIPGLDDCEEIDDVDTNTDIDDDVVSNNELLSELEDYDPRLDLSLYKFPELDLLNNYEIKEMDRETIMAELRENKDKIETTLKHFGILIKQISVTMGPTVTLYEIVPADGIRISKIKNLEDDIALNLAALGIRIIAPIPGKGTIGIEVPNKNSQLVSMKEIINSEKFQNNKFDLPIGLGKTISNEPFVVDLAKMPHLLMAGATGQGKSVGLNAIITSLLYTKHPSELKIVLVDPKKVEFTLYSVLEKYFLAKLPDIEDPIVTDTKDVVRTLNSLCVEMYARLDLLKLAKTRNIKEYNHKFCTRKLSPALGHRYLPFIVLIIDEFADLIMTAGRDVEIPIARLAQLARAIGIHLIIATQRPSVNIITGTIKANFPARLAYRVVQKIDSRTILDENGANQLIGKGDMLLSTGSDLIRLQCAFVDTPEVERLVLFVERQQAYSEPFLLPEYILEEKGKGNAEEEIDTGEIDQMFMEAATLIVQTQMGSTSLIQRKMKLGYNRAGRIMDQLEEFGIVGHAMGSKAREVKVKSNEELMQIFKRMGLF
ncbi:MAG: DNA translocase FtsK [Bacteroidales bacterium]|jgi:S-DNA-T family DNA segregation ATPase FtsK/SpoIIIE|nr:DNA translocase FtsK [Bacteroidales bacterium]